MGLLTDSEKAAIFADFNNAMETFLRPLTVYQEAARTVISSDDNYNPLDAWRQNVNAPVEFTAVQSQISGRIMWSKDQDWKYLSPGGVHPAQLKVKDSTKMSCRLKVNHTGFALLANAKKVEIDGVLMNLESEPRPHGPFGTGYWDFYFVRSS